MAGLARRLAPAAALGGLAIVIVGVADPALAGRTETTATGSDAVSSSVQRDSAAPSAPEADSPVVATCADGGDDIAGGAAMTPWGPVQVTATVAGTQVCSVQAVSWPSSDRRSQMINSYAIPQLDALATRSPMQFDYVSGATYTSQGYHDSLQSILDSL